MGHSSVVWLQGTAAWMRRGSLGVDVWLLVGGCAVVAAVALGAWYALFRPNLTDLVAAYVPAAPLELLVLGGLLFSMLNATVEEGAYRGVDSARIGGDDRPREGGPCRASGSVWRTAHQRVPQRMGRCGPCDHLRA